MNVCNKCNKPAEVFGYSKVLNMVVCTKCKAETGEKTTGRRGVFDSLGKPRDRDWLRHKLDITSTEKKWHEDIKSRRVAPDGSITRIKR